MQNFGRENFDDSTCIRQNSSDFSTVKVLRYTVLSHPWYYAWCEQIILQDCSGGLSVARGTTYMAIMVGPRDNQWQPHLVWGD